MDRVAELIKQEFESGDLCYIDAIDELICKCGYSPLDAEIAVSDWEEEFEE